MKIKSKKEQQISRRSMIPILGSSLLIPFIGFGNSGNENREDENFQILLKPDGTTVKVKSSSIKQAKIIKKNIANKSFLKWLDKKF